MISTKNTDGYLLFIINILSYSNLYCTLISVVFMQKMSQIKPNSFLFRQHQNQMKKKSKIPQICSALGSLLHPHHCVSVTRTKIGSLFKTKIHVLML